MGRRLPLPHAAQASIIQRVPIGTTDLQQPLIRCLSSEATDIKTFILKDATPCRTQPSLPPQVHPVPGRPFLASPALPRGAASIHRKSHRTPEIVTSPTHVPETSPEGILVNRCGRYYVPVNHMPVATPPPLFLIPFRPLCVRCQEKNHHETRKIEFAPFQMWFSCVLTLAAPMISVSLMPLLYINYSQLTVTVNRRSTSTTSDLWVGVPAGCAKPLKRLDNIKQQRIPTTISPVKPTFTVC